jgi:hypothetical protein
LTQKPACYEMLHNAVHLVRLIPAKEISMIQYITVIQTVHEHAANEYRGAEAAPLTFNAGDGWKSVRTPVPINQEDGSR